MSGDWMREGEGLAIKWSAVVIVSVCVFSKENSKPHYRERYFLECGCGGGVIP